MAGNPSSPSEAGKCVSQFSSNSVSTQNSPSNLCFELSEKSIFDFSFFESRKDAKTDDCEVKTELTKANSSESLNFSKTSFVTELETMLNQTKELNCKLQNNLSKLKEREKKQVVLAESLARQTRKRRSFDSCLKEEVLCSCATVLGGLLRILCVGWNCYYCFKSEFYFEDFQAICYSFVAAPSAVFLLITLASVSFDISKCRFNKVLFKLGLGLLIAIGGPLGAPLFVYAILLAINDSHTGDFHIIDSIARVTSLIESLFESLPQIALQIYNNNKMQLWSDNLKLISIILSLLGIFYTVYKLCSSVDKVQQYESAVSLKIRPSVTDEKVTTARKSNYHSDSHNANHVSDLEVYEMGEEVHVI